MGQISQTSILTKISLFVFGLLVGALAVWSYFYFFVDKGSDGTAKPTTQTEGILLSLSSPNNGSVVSEKNMTISGSTGKNSILVITGVTKTKILETSQGTFSETVELAEGQNEITVYAFDISTGENSQASLNVLFISEQIAHTSLLVAQENNNNIEEKVEDIKEKLATGSAETKTLGLPNTHIFGRLVSIDESTLTIDTGTNGTKIVFVDDLTRYSDTGPKNSSIIQIEDLKIGDLVSAAGISSEDTTGKVKFVVRQTRVGQIAFAIAGKVGSVEQNNLTIESLDQNGLSSTLVLSGQAEITVKGVSSEADISDISKGAVIVSAGIINKDGDLVTDTLFVIPTSQKSDQEESTQSATPSAKP